MTSLQNVPFLLSLSSVALVLLLLANLPIPSASSSPSLRHLSQNLTSIHFIGDLHADVHCAKQWVERTNLVNLTTTPYQWIGPPDTSALVFLGDYVDKGSTSAAVLQFVQSLQQTFPNNVLTILGNHDFFLVLDTALSFSADHPHPLGTPFYDYAYSFMHPEEYLESEWTPERDDDVELMGSMLSALQYVYDGQMQGSVHLCAPHCDKDQRDIFDSASGIPPYNTNLPLAQRASERLYTWRKEYAHGLYESGLLQWLTSQPLIAVVGDALIVHGGLSDRVVNHLSSVSERMDVSVHDALHKFTNEAFSAFFEEQWEKVTGANSIVERMTENFSFEIILDMVQHRGYFDPQKGCRDVDRVIRAIDSSYGELKGVNRIVVGHTPHDYAHERCGGRLLASDSSLSRTFRAHGNMYCPISERMVEGYGGKSVTCEKRHDEVCEGSISMIRRSSPEEDWPRSVTRMKHDEFDNKNERGGGSLSEDSSDDGTNNRDEL